MYRALIIHPNNDDNCGDQLTFLGTKALLTKALGGSRNLDVVRFNMQEAHGSNPGYMKETAWGDIDMIVLAGSPWLWSCCGKSRKYKLLYDAIERYPNAKRIGLGLGSCYTRIAQQYEYESKLLCEQELRVPYKDTIGTFDYLIVRDVFAQSTLGYAGVIADYTYDTSIYSYNHFGFESAHSDKHDRSILWFYDPSIGLSGGYLDFDSAEYINFELNWASENNADIFCHHHLEAKYLSEHNIKVSFSTDLDFLFYKLQDYSTMLSGRVHMAALGFLAGIQNITVMPVDSRFQTVEKLGIDFKFIGEPWIYEHPIVQPNLWISILDEEARIIRELQSVLLGGSYA